MEPFTTLTAIAAPLLRANVDTDVIIRIERAILPRSDLARYAFSAWRYLPDGREDPQFVLNQPGYADARILLAGPNFGCGSSREAAVWALQGLGIRCVIAPGFGEIFEGNCFQNGVLPVVLPMAAVEALADVVADDPRGRMLTVDLGRCLVLGSNGSAYAFNVDPARKVALLSGLDDIAMTMTLTGEIDAFQRRDKAARPWVHLPEYLPPALSDRRA